MRGGKRGKDMAGSFSLLTDRNGQLSRLSDEATAAVGQDEKSLGARPLFALFAADDGESVAAALKGASSQTETNLPGLRVVLGDAGEALFDLRFQPAGPDRFWAFFTPAAGEPGEEGPSEKQAFLLAVAERLGQPGALAAQMIMLDVGALGDAEMRARLGEEGMRDVRSGIESALSAAALDGQVGRLDATSYGVLSDAGQDPANMVASVADAAGAFGIGEEELALRSKSVALDAEAVTDTESLRGLLSHTCHKFYQSVRNGAPFGASRLSEVSAEIEQAINLIETALEKNDVNVSVRDVRRLTDGQVTHYLAHGTLVFGDEIVEAERLLPLEDHPKLCGRLDRVVTAVAVNNLPEVNAATTVIVDIDLPTLESGEAARIAADMAEAGWSVGFRPKGIDMTSGRSRGVRQVYDLLKDGVPVWLMNFTTAIKKTRRLKGAFVEVSATLLRDISLQKDRNRMLSQLLGVWNEVNVQLVAVNVDSKNLASFVSKLGIAYGTGIAADPAADAPQSSRDAVA